MANSETTVPQAKAPKRSWLKKLLFVFGALIVLLVVAWFVVTSEAFFKGSIVPRIGKAMNATLTVDSASISPFSQVTLRGVKLQTTGTEPLLTVTELRARYSLTAMLGGNIKVDEVLIDSPAVTVVENADGTRNTDQLTQGKQSSAKESKPASAKAGKPPQVDLKQFNLKNATVRYIKNHAGGTRDTIEITGVNVTLDDVKNGAAGKLAFALDAKADLNPPDVAQRGSLQARNEGKYTFTLGQDLFPSQISGSDKVDITQATGALKELAGGGLDFSAEMTPGEIKGVVVSFRKSGATLAELRVTGPFDAMKREGELTVSLSGVDRKLLNLAGAVAGLDFNSTTVNSTNLIEISKGGAMVGVNGHLGIAAMQVTRTNQTTPTLALATEYALTVDNEKSSATLRTLNLNGQQNGRSLLKSELSAPMTFAWGNTANAVGDASLTVTLSELNLADWKPFLGTNGVSTGTINAKLGVLSQEAGKKLGVDLTSSIENLATAPGANILSAKINLNSVIKQQDNAMTVTGKLSIPEIASRNGTNELRLPVTSAEFDVAKTGEVIDIKQCLAKLVATERAKNELSLTGRVDMTKPEAITGGLKLTAEALDFTAYYDLFTGTTMASPQKPAKPAPKDTSKEPEAITMPFHNFTFDVNLARIYLREVDISNLVANAKLDGGHMVVKPLQCSLNGAPIKGSLDVDLGVRGFQYDFMFDAPNIPLTPLVNSFQPERKGQINGTATASAQFKGAGVTGASLQKNLTGQFDLVATNLNLSLENVRTPVIKQVINVIVAIPGAIKNPTAALGNIVGGLIGTKTSGDSTVDQWMKSPINDIVAHGTAGGGKIELKQAYVQSTAFRSEATGQIEIANVLSNSVMQFPVSVSLSKGVSDKLGLTPSDTPTNAVFVALPDFLKMRGTLGKPDPKPDWLVLGKIALKSASGMGLNIGSAATDKVGGALGTVENLLGGQRSATNSSTNAAPTTNHTANDLIRDFGGLLGGKKKSPTTNPPPPAAKP